MADYYNFTAFQSYSIGKGILRDIRSITDGYGLSFLVLADEHISDKALSDIRESIESVEDMRDIEADNLLGRPVGVLDDLPRGTTALAPSKCEIRRLPYKICSVRSAEAAGRIINDADSNIVVALGASKCLDLVRAGMHYASAHPRPKLVLCPSIISSNASATGMSVMYDEDSGQMSDFWNLAAMPEYCIVDMEMIQATPPRAFAAGIGDQVSSSFEALHTIEHLDSSIDPLCAAHHRDVLHVLERYSVDAVNALKQHRITKEFEWVCHVLTRYTGPQLAGAASYMSHILDEALHSIPAVASRMHGEVVGFCILAELAACKEYDEVRKWAELYRRIGIPTTLEELGIPGISREELVKCCEASSDRIMASRSLVRWGASEMADCVIEADRIVCDHSA